MLKKINFFNDRSNRDTVLTKIISFFAIENNILFIRLVDENSYERYSSFSQVTEITISNIENLNIENVQKMMFNIDLIVFDISDYYKRLEFLIEKIIEISIKLNKVTFINVNDTTAEIINLTDIATDLDFGYFKLSTEYSPIIVPGHTLKFSDTKYIISNEIDKSSVTFDEFKKSFIRDRKIDDLIN